ncbi:unnamed protein product [Lepeophtheirus salmonis]|uniref:(salmon louse) hypothetical protein n=1 Tax=Lepeophtheirus salmonis TaxID=72036 RepID=A0A7R8CJ02_LEPSM|nr:unnamed protein product [Lepeophtheirus salmonis]CAF2837311.1 unnamed protein product [Lepeophtheirus salmonis]
MTLPPLGSTLVMGSSAPSLSTNEPFVTGYNYKQSKLHDNIMSSSIENRFPNENDSTLGSIPDINPTTGLRKVLGSNRSIEAYYRHLERFQVPRTTSWTNLRALLNSDKNNNFENNSVMPIGCKNPPRILKPIRLVEHNRDRSMWLFGNPWSLTEPKVLQERPLLHGEEKDSLGSIEYLNTESFVPLNATFKGIYFDLSTILNSLKKNRFHNENKWDINEKRPATTFHNQFNRYSVVPPFTPSKKLKKHKEDKLKKSGDKVGDKKLFMDSIDTIENVFINFLNDNMELNYSSKPHQSPIDTSFERDQNNNQQTHTHSDDEEMNTEPYKPELRKSTSINNLSNDIDKGITSTNPETGIESTSSEEKNVSSDEHKGDKTEIQSIKTSEKEDDSNSSPVKDTGALSTEPKSDKSKVHKRRQYRRSKKENQKMKTRGKSNSFPQKKRLSRRDTENNNDQAPKISRNKSYDDGKTRMNNEKVKSKEDRKAKRTSSLPGNKTRQVVNKWYTEESESSKSNKKHRHVSNNALSPKKQNKDSHNRVSTTKNRPDLNTYKMNRADSISSTLEKNNINTKNSRKLRRKEKLNQISTDGSSEEIESNITSSKGWESKKTSVSDKEDDSTPKNSFVTSGSSDELDLLNSCEKREKDDAQEVLDNKDEINDVTTFQISPLIKSKDQDSHEEEELNKNNIESRSLEVHDMEEEASPTQEKKDGEKMSPSDDNESVPTPSSPNIRKKRQIVLRLLGKFKEHFNSKRMVLFKMKSFDETAFKKSIKNLCDEIANKKILNTTDKETTIPESLLPMAFNKRPSFNFSYQEEPKFESNGVVVNAYRTPKKTSSALSILRRKREMMYKMKSRYL